jgi:hypothetical protein
MATIKMICVHCTLLFVSEETDENQTMSQFVDTKFETGMLS